MEIDFNKKLVTDVLSYIPENVKPVVFLVTTLNISRESAYRRMRGDIPFTVQEIVLLSIKLEFSLDQLFEQEKQNHAFLDLSRMGKSSNDFFLLMLKKDAELFEKISQAENMNALMALNSFPPAFLVNYPHLFKFTYYKWLYQDIDISRNASYSDVVLPEEAILFRKKVKENMNQKMNFTLILDTDIFLCIIKEIQYFYHRKLLNKEELLLLKEDILHLINQYDEFSQTGNYGQAKIQLYLSSLCVNSNTAYFKYDDKAEPLFWIFTVNPVIIQNSGFISMQTKWLNTLKRQSALITQSNEIMQAEFFSRQRDYYDKYLRTDIV